MNLLERDLTRNSESETVAVFSLEAIVKILTTRNRESDWTVSLLLVNDHSETHSFVSAFLVRSTKYSRRDQTRVPLLIWSQQSIGFFPPFSPQGCRIVALCGETDITVLFFLQLLFIRGISSQ